MWKITWTKESLCIKQELGNEVILGHHDVRRLKNYPGGKTLFATWMVFNDTRNIWRWKILLSRVSLFHQEIRNYNQRKSPSSLIQNFCREFLPSKDQRALFSKLPLASIIGNLPEITLQYLRIAVTFQRMEIKSSFQASIYKLICAPLNHAVNSSWFQLNLEIKKDSQEILLL